MEIFLFVTANEHEKAAFQEKFIERDSDNINAKTYYHGKFGNYDAAYIHIDEQGTTNPASTLLVGELIRTLKPVAVIMVGIAFGADEENQNIGDVLVSKYILPYDSQKVLETGNKNKEPPKKAGFHLLNAFSNKDGWEYKSVDGTRKSVVYDGNLLTGSKLVNNREFKKELLQFFEDHNPIGGEMEANGIYAACTLHGIPEWIIVKGICDWGYDKDNSNKENDQIIAAKAAVGFCHYVFSRYGVFDDLLSQHAQAPSTQKTDNLPLSSNESDDCNGISADKPNTFMSSTDYTELENKSMSKSLTG